MDKQLKMYWKKKEKEKSFLINSSALYNPRLFVILQGTSLLIWGTLQQTSDAYLSIKIGSCDEQWFNYMTITANNAWRIPKICRARVAVINARERHWLSVKSSIARAGGRLHPPPTPSSKVVAAVWFQILTLERAGHRQTEDGGRKQTAMIKAKFSTQVTESNRLFLSVGTYALSTVHLLLKMRMRDFLYFRRWQYWASEKYMALLCRFRPIKTVALCDGERSKTSQIPCSTHSN